MVRENIKKIYYRIACKDEFADRELALTLLDLFGFNQNIVINIFRAYSDSDKIIKSFSNEIPCRIVKDVTRSDCYCIFIPQLQNNRQLMKLIKAMDIQTEWTYIPSVNNFEDLLFNWNYISKENSVKYKFSNFEAYFDSDFGLQFFINLDYFEKNEVETNFLKWENMFNGVNFKKK